MILNIFFKFYCFKIVNLECRMFYVYSYIFYWSYYFDVYKDFGFFCYFDFFISIFCLFVNKIKFFYYCEIIVDEIIEII